MGYTHYWHQTGPIDPDDWEKIKADAAKLFEHHQMVVPENRIAYEDDRPNDPPIVDDDYIGFNGIGDNGHETFLLEREPTGRKYERKFFAFCKTAQKPYDSVVCAVLACVAEHTSTIEVSSDGRANEWAPALAWASDVLGRPIAFPVKVDA
jgi:hypothetical protein